MSETEKPRDWAAMTVKQLRACCAEQGLTREGTKKELIQRLTVEKYGRADKFVHGRTKCKLCGSQMNPVHTDRKTAGIVVRLLQCRAHRAHRYPLVEKV